MKTHFKKNEKRLKNVKRKDNVIIGNSMKPVVKKFSNKHKITKNNYISYIEDDY
jgi:hypothetical protein